MSGAADAARPVHAVRPDPEGGFRIVRGAVSLSLPDGTVLRVASRPLADAIAAECAATPAGRGGLFRLQATLQGRVAVDRDRAVDQLLAFDCELLCYRDAAQPSNAAREAAEWQPLLDWAAAEIGAAPRVVHGVMPQPQPAAVRDGLARRLARLDDRGIAALLAAVPALGSVVLGLALVLGRTDPSETAAACLLDQRLCAERWGEMDDYLAARDRLAGELASVARFLALSEA